MSNAFERHGIDHLSPSSLNLWAAEPALWVMERLLGKRAPQRALGARGHAVEHGVHCGLVDPAFAIEVCIDEALRLFDREMALTPDDKREAERNHIAGYVTHALAELRQYGQPSAYQERVEIRLDDVPVPIVGIVDWLFDQHGLIVDLKTSDRLPSAVSAAHGRQGAVYARSRSNYAMRFAYAKPSPAKKDGRAVVVYELTGEDVQRHLVALRQIALRLGRFLALSNDRHILADLLVPNYDDFRWNQPAQRANGEAVFGF